MRLITYTIVLIFIPSILFCQTLDEREKIMISKNKIQNRTQFDYGYTKGVVDKTGKKTSLTQFNKSGDVTEKKIFNAKGIVTGTEIYNYDAKGNRILYERDGSSGKYKKVSVYNNKNNVITETGFNGAENFKNTFTYTPQDKVASIVYVVNNKVEEKRVYSYTGNVCIIQIYAGGNTLTSKLKLSYDAKGNVLEEILLTIDEKVTSKKKFKYNHTQQIIVEEKNLGGALNYRLSYAYDALGNLVSISEETTSVKKYVKKSYSYDSKGNLTEYKWRRSSGDEFNVKKYTYDAKGVCLTEHTYYPNTKYELLTKYQYGY